MNFRPYGEGRGNSIRICFCATPNPLPVEPLTAHHEDCLVWDWALANGLISPGLRLAQLASAIKTLGVTEEELEDAAP